MDEDADVGRPAGGEGSSDQRSAGAPDPGAVGDTNATVDVLGGPDGGPGLDLDHERFAYAGKFVTSRTGKGVVREPGSGGDAAGEVLAAATFDRDRTDRSVIVVRYVTVRRDRRGEGLGARLLATLAERALGGMRSDVDGTEAPPTFGDVRRVTIAVNNPFAFEAAFKAGFGYTGERTGLAELRCARPGDRSAAAYRRGLSAFLDRGDLDDAERAFVDERRDAGPPKTVAPLPGP